jgi:hypothetical protein
MAHPTQSNRLVFYKADIRRMSLIGDRGEQRNAANDAE